MRAQQSTIVGVFEDRQQADRAVDELRRAGFRDDQIGVAMRHDERELGGKDVAGSTDESHAGAGTVTGAMAGLGLGAARGPRGPLRGHPRDRAGHRRRDAGHYPHQCRGRGRHRRDWSAPWPGPASRRTRPTTIRANSNPAGRSSPSRPRAAPTRHGHPRRYDAYDMSSRPGVAGYDQAGARTATTDRAATCPVRRAVPPAPRLPRG